MKNIEISKFTFVPLPKFQDSSWKQEGWSLSETAALRGYGACSGTLGPCLVKCQRNAHMAKGSEITSQAVSSAKELKYKSLIAKEKQETRE